MKRSIIIGAGGFGLEMLHILQDAGSAEILGFVDSDTSRWGERLGGIPILGGDGILESIREEGAAAAYVAVGMSPLRRAIGEKLSAAGFVQPALIHPKAYVSTDVEIGDATTIYPGAVVMAGCRIGNGVLINAGATLGHETTAGDYCNINPGASAAGRVHIGEEALVGIGSTILENLTVGRSARVGGGAVVTRDVEPDITVMGVPARPTSKSG